MWFGLSVGLFAMSTSSNDFYWVYTDTGAWCCELGVHLVTCHVPCAVHHATFAWWGIACGDRCAACFGTAMAGFCLKCAYTTWPVGFSSKGRKVCSCYYCLQGQVLAMHWPAMSCISASFWNISCIWSYALVSVKYSDEFPCIVKGLVPCVMVSLSWALGMPTLKPVILVWCYSLRIGLLVSDNVACWSMLSGSTPSFQIAHTSAGCAIPQPINGTSEAETKLSSSFEAMSRMAKAAAKHSGKQLLYLGEAGRRYIASQYEHWVQNGHEACGADRCDTQVPYISIQS